MMFRVGDVAGTSAAGLLLVGPRTTGLAKEVSLPLVSEQVSGGDQPTEEAVQLAPLLAGGRTAREINIRKVNTEHKDAHNYRYVVFGQTCSTCGEQIPIARIKAQKL